MAKNNDKITQWMTMHLPNFRQSWNPVNCFMHLNLRVCYSKARPACWSYIKLQFWIVVEVVTHGRDGTSWVRTAGGPERNALDMLYVLGVILHVKKGSLTPQWFMMNNGHTVKWVHSQSAAYKTLAELISRYKYYSLPMSNSQERPKGEESASKHCTMSQQQI